MNADDRNIEAVHRGFEAMRRGDVEGLLADCDPDIEFAAFVSQVLVTGTTNVRGR